MKLIDALHKANRRLAVNDSFWEKIQLRRAARVFIKVMANTLLPLTYRISKPRGEDKRPVIPVVVSLTSFPVRIGRLWIVIESILRQTVRPERIVLWLSRDQFPNEERDLPKSLLAQRLRGLDIRFVDGDIRSHKKYYYAFKEFENSLVLTIDDDLLFPSNYLADIYECKLRHPDNIIASFGFRFNWDNASQYISFVETIINAGDSGNDLFFGSGGGTLFDPKSLKINLSIDDILKLCPAADDIYLNAIVRLNGCEITFLSNNPLLALESYSETKLVEHNGNILDSHSTNALQLKALTSYLQEKYSTNPFQTK